MSSLGGAPPNWLGQSGATSSLCNSGSPFGAEARENLLCGISPTKGIDSNGMGGLGGVCTPQNNPPDFSWEPGTSIPGVRREERLPSWWGHARGAGLILLFYSFFFPLSSPEP